MARSALILVPLLFLSGCQTLQGKLSNAKSAEAIANTAPQLPDLPDACTAMMNRAYPNTKEPWVILQKRWLILSDNRDRKAEDCAKWWADYRASMAKTGGNT